MLLEPATTTSKWSKAPGKKLLTRTIIFKEGLIGLTLIVLKN